MLGKDCVTPFIHYWLDWTTSAIRVLGNSASTDIQEASSLSHSYGSIQVYSSSWGPDDDGSTVMGPRVITSMVLEQGVRRVGDLHMCTCCVYGVYVCVCVHVCVYVCSCVYVHVCMCACVHVCMCICVCVHVYVCMCMCAHVHVCMCMYMCMCACVCAYMVY